MSKLTKSKHRPPQAEKRVEISVIAKLAGTSRDCIRRYCRKGLAIQNGKKSTKGVRLSRAVLEHDPQFGNTLNTTEEAWQRFLAKINPGG